MARKEPARLLFAFCYFLYKIILIFCLIFVIMLAVTLENVPSTFTKKFGSNVDFNKILGLYWDGMDWCQYGEVLPDEDDIFASNNYSTEISKNNANDFLENLISK